MTWNRTPRRFAEHRPGQVAAEVQRLQHQLRDEIEREPRLLERRGGGRQGDDRTRLLSHGHGSASAAAVEICRSLEVLGRASPGPDPARAPAGRRRGRERHPLVQRHGAQVVQRVGRRPVERERALVARPGHGVVAEAVEHGPQCVLRRRGARARSTTARYASPSPSAGKPQSRHRRARSSYDARVLRVERDCRGQVVGGLVGDPRGAGTPRPLADGSRRWARPRPRAARRSARHRCSRSWERSAARGSPRPRPGGAGPWPRSRNVTHGRRWQTAGCTRADARGGSGSGRRCAWAQPPARSSRSERAGSMRACS